MPRRRDALDTVATVDDADSITSAPRRHHSHHGGHSTSAALARLRRPHIIAAAVLLLVALLWAWGAQHTLVRAVRTLAQTPTFNRFRLLVSPGARDTYAVAQRYYDTHYPKVQASAEGADGFELHWYFSHTVAPEGAIGEEVSWYDLIGARINAMYDLLRSYGRDDFRVEKDRCEMYAFFERVGLPYVPVAKTEYGDAVHLAGEVVTGGFFHELLARKDELRYPLFLKACHLTQGAMKAVLPIPSADHLTDPHKLREIAHWAEAKLGMRADDWERPWRAEGNALTDTLRPGLMVQEAHVTSFNPYKQKHMAIELKVEVLWGYPYIAVTSDFHPGTLFLRDGTVEIFPDNWSQVFFTASNEIHPSLRWIPDHLECVWRLAAHAARTIQADNVRIDIFLDEQNPDGCVINEISLSSGMQYGMHFPFLTKAWAYPLRQRRYTIASDRVAPVYHPGVP